LLDVSAVPREAGPITRDVPLLDEATRGSCLWLRSALLCGDADSRAAASPVADPEWTGRDGLVPTYFG